MNNKATEIIKSVLKKTLFTEHITCTSIVSNICNNSTK